MTVASSTRATRLGSAARDASAAAGARHVGEDLGATRRGEQLRDRGEQLRDASLLEDGRHVAARGLATGRSSTAQTTLCEVAP
jgi:hypothetical protein